MTKRLRLLYKGVACQSKVRKRNQNLNKVLRMNVICTKNILENAGDLMIRLIEIYFKVTKVKNIGRRKYKYIISGSQL